MSGVQRINEQHGHARSTDGTVVQLSDGAKVKVWPLGGKDRTEPLLDALHDAPGLSSHIEPADSFEFLASWLRVLVYDARGSGQSDLKGPLTNEPWIADVDELREWAGAVTFVLAGGSCGGFLSFNFALAYPTRLRGHVLRGTWGYGLRGVLRAFGTVLTDDRVKVDLDRLVRLSSGGLRDDDDFAASFTGILTMLHRRRPSPKHSRALLLISWQTAAFSYSVPRFDVRSRLGEIKAPMLVIVGRHDAVCTVSDAEELHRGISNSELAIFEKSGHSPPSEKPEAFRERLIKFLDDQKL